MKVSAKQYARTLYFLTQNKSESEIDNIIVRFVSYIKKSGDMKKAQDVIGQFKRVYNDKNNIIEATVTSVRALSVDEQDKIRLFIKIRYNAKSVVINSAIDKSIKGGIIIRVRDEVLDGSVNGKLSLLKHNLG